MVSLVINLRQPAEKYMRLWNTTKSINLHFRKTFKPLSRKLFRVSRFLDGFYLTGSLSFIFSCSRLSIETFTHSAKINLLGAVKSPLLKSSNRLGAATSVAESTLKSMIMSRNVRKRHLKSPSPNPRHTPSNRCRWVWYRRHRRERARISLSIRSNTLVELIFRLSIWGKC